MNSAMKHQHHRPAATSARILVVDDQPANIQVVGSVLGKLGHEIVPASDGLTALKRIAVRQPDLILLDLLMPGMDGCEVCRHVRENPDWNDIPVIFLSAADDKDLIVRALDSGGVDYITKPFNQAELVSRVRTHLALKNARDRLKQLAEDKDELMGILTHDLKSHLAGIEMSALVLRDRVVKLQDGRSTQLAENILHSGTQLLSFVKEFLANAAADHGLEIKPTTLNLSEVATIAIRQYQEPARRKQLEIVVEAPEQAFVLADSSALNQVVDNLLSNAIKFSPSGKRIFFKVQSRNSHVEFKIQDQGPGFMPEDKPRLFRRYARLSARPTAGEPSTGLGLSIVNKLVHAMNGELSYHTIPGEGTTFTVQLPHSTKPT
jgi:two-component system sensor histidine kinase/response regulator